MAAYSQADLESLTIPNPEKIEQNFRNWNATDRILNLGFVGIGILSWMMLTDYGAFGVVGTVLLWYGIMYRSRYGRTYQVFGQWVRTQWIIWALGGVLWLAEPDLDSSKLRGVLRRAPPHQLIVDRVATIGLVHDSKRRTDSIVVEAAGSNISSLDLAVMFEAQLAIADVIRTVASLQGVRVGVSWVFRRRPLNQPALQDMYIRNIHPAVWAPEALDKPESDWTAFDRRMMSLRKLTIARIDMVSAVANDVVMAAVFTLQREGALREAEKDQVISESAVTRLSIIRAAETAINGLARCGVANLRVLDAAEVHSYLRGAWDVTDSHAYNEDMAQMEAEEPGQGVETSLYWPQERIVVPRKGPSKHKVIQVDNTHHAVLQITQIPPKRLPTYFRRLFGINVPYMSVAMVGQAVKGAGEYWFLDKYKPLRDEVESKLGIIWKGPKARKRDEALELRMEEIFESVYGQDVNILIGLAHVSEQEVEDSVHEAFRVINSSNMRAARIEGESRLMGAVMAANTGI